MSYRGVVCLVLAVSFIPSLGSADEWCCKFDRARKMAIKHAGPESIAASHFHMENKQVIAVEDKRIKKKAPSKKRRKTPSRSGGSQSRQIMQKADRARANGQLEQALRLYRLANGMSPGSEAAKKIADVEREMN